jgi:hypothetical protein
MAERQRGLLIDLPKSGMNFYLNNIFGSDFIHDFGFGGVGTDRLNALARVVDKIRELVGYQISIPVDELQGQDTSQGQTKKKRQGVNLTKKKTRGGEGGDDEADEVKVEPGAPLSVPVAPPADSPSEIERTDDSEAIKDILEKTESDIAQENIKDILEKTESDITQENVKDIMEKTESGITQEEYINIREEINEMLQSDIFKELEAYDIELLGNKEPNEFYDYLTYNVLYKQTPWLPISLNDGSDDLKNIPLSVLSYGNYPLSEGEIRSCELITNDREKAVQLAKIHQIFSFQLDEFVSELLLTFNAYAGTKLIDTDEISNPEGSVNETEIRPDVIQSGGSKLRDTLNSIVKGMIIAKQEVLRKEQRKEQRTDNNYIEELMEAVINKYIELYVSRNNLNSDLCQALYWTTYDFNLNSAVDVDGVYYAEGEAESRACSVCFRNKVYYLLSKVRGQLNDILMNTDFISRNFNITTRSGVSFPKPEKTLLTELNDVIIRDEGGKISSLYPNLKSDMTELLTMLSEIEREKANSYAVSIAVKVKESDASYEKISQILSNNDSEEIRPIMKYISEHLKFIIDDAQNAQQISIRLAGTVRSLTDDYITLNVNDILSVVKIIHRVIHIMTDVVSVINHVSVDVVVKQVNELSSVANIVLDIASKIASKIESKIVNIRKKNNIISNVNLCCSTLAKTMNESFQIFSQINTFLNDTGSGSVLSELDSFKNISTINDRLREITRYLPRRTRLRVETGSEIISEENYYDIISKIISSGNWKIINEETYPIDLYFSSYFRTEIKNIVLEIVSRPTRILPSVSFQEHARAAADDSDGVEESKGSEDDGDISKKSGDTSMSGLDGGGIHGGALTQSTPTDITAPELVAAPAQPPEQVPQPPEQVPQPQEQVPPPPEQVPQPPEQVPQPPEPEAPQPGAPEPGEQVTKPVKVRELDYDTCVSVSKKLNEIKQKAGEFKTIELLTIKEKGLLIIRELNILVDELFTILFGEERNERVEKLLKNSKNSMVSLYSSISAKLMGSLSRNKLDSLDRLVKEISDIYEKIVKDNCGKIFSKRREEEEAEARLLKEQAEELKRSQEGLINKDWANQLTIYVARSTLIITKAIDRDGVIRGDILELRKPPTGTSSPKILGNWLMYILHLFVLLKEADYLTTSNQTILNRFLREQGIDKQPSFKGSLDDKTIQGMEYVLNRYFLNQLISNNYKEEGLFMNDFSRWKSRAGSKGKTLINNAVVNWPNPLSDTDSFCPMSSINDAQSNCGSYREALKNKILEVADINITFQELEEESLYYNLRYLVRNEPRLEPDECTILVDVYLGDGMDDITTSPVIRQNLFISKTTNMNIPSSSPDKLMGACNVLSNLLSTIEFMWRTAAISFPNKSPDQKSDLCWSSMLTKHNYYDFLKSSHLKALGDSTQELNGALKFGGYTSAGKRTYTGDVIYYYGGTATNTNIGNIEPFDENGDAFRGTLSNDRQAGTRTLWLLTCLPNEVINQRSFGGLSVNSEPMYKNASDARGLVLVSAVPEPKSSVAKASTQTRKKGGKLTRISKKNRISKKYRLKSNKK